MQKILVTGGAGFIGSNLIDKLIEEYEIVNIDVLNDYYDPRYKKENIKNHLKKQNYRFRIIDIRDYKKLEEVFEKEKPQIVVHLAAMAGVRNSFKKPKLYLDTNFGGTKNLLKLSTQHKVGHFILGSSSSVYGNSHDIPFSEENLNLNPISPYGKSKLKAEKATLEFGKKFNLPITILRFFTVYGPRGRPDMAPYLFTKAILSKTAIKKFGKGDTERDFTYIDDIVSGIILTIKKRPSQETINLGNSRPISLDQFIATLEKVTSKALNYTQIGSQKGDVEKTYADIKKAKKILGWQPKTNIQNGLANFVSWFLNSGR